jgi:hypothetical protein
MGTIGYIENQGTKTPYRGSEKPQEGRKTVRVVEIALGGEYDIDDLTEEMSNSLESLLQLLIVIECGDQLTGSVSGSISWFYAVESYIRYLRAVVNTIRKLSSDS